MWASSPHLRSKLKLHRETKQKSKRKSEESQLPSKSEGCNERQGFRGNCDSQASWGCAPALPNRIRVVFLEELLLGKTVFSVRQKGVPPLLLPASVLQLPRCLVRICNLFLINHKIANLTVSKMQLQQGKQTAKSICFANVGCSPTPRQHF